ncbi:hypothetical protein HNQ93_003387 [Hymenobacter luteus]|uniref:DUF3575 domain-containing protein n=2 Tax=Hymenobacter TaxID=89966 RepID=A0A7W9T4D3_9BACT|nr:MULTISPECIES: hypothetical protein [Hymenobacter]MBB4602622.1 hypothetical protein [Hymenobacter latericoloratus]MBB6060513.1 hypothetical protein [Hymenobacter luteus]
MSLLVRIPGTLGSLLLAGCSAYAPTSPAVPMVESKGEAEVSGSMQLNGRVEARGVYSPVRHVLVGVGGSTRPNFSSSTFFRVQQAEAMAGGYAKLSEQILFSGMLGAGGARTNRRFREILGGREQYQARYATLFGQAGLGWQLDNGGSISLGYRLTSVRFRQLRDEAQDLPLQRMSRHEILLNLRHNPGWGAQWQTQTSIGISGGRRPGDGPDNDPTAFGVQYTQLPGFLVSLGVVWRPGLRNW